MRRIGKLLLMSAAALTLALAGCGGAGGSQVVGHWGGGSPGAPILTFEDAGTFAGSDGCAPAGGTWYQKGADIHLTIDLMGAVMCPPEYWMNRAETVRVQDGTLLILDADGRQIGQLPGHG